MYITRLIIIYLKILYKYLNNILFLSYNFILTISLITYLISKKKKAQCGLSTAIMITLFYLIYQIFIYQI